MTKPVNLLQFEIVMWGHHMELCSAPHFVVSFASLGHDDVHPLRSHVFFFFFFFRLRVQSGLHIVPRVPCCSWAHYAHGTAYCTLTQVSGTACHFTKAHRNFTHTQRLALCLYTYIQSHHPDEHIFSPFLLC
uniref:Uncharacterized protein n=1 Tax=Trypanosoma vivax (strain Y486) TaxID=1055687 RepID=G0U6J9_TRYVY|nr:hypothetical protein TVY486_1005540 [Trypanosoma vivax Y486]